MATEKPATQAKRVLVVEDEPMIRILLEDMLGELGSLPAARRSSLPRAMASCPSPIATGRPCGSRSRSTASRACC